MIKIIRRTFEAAKFPKGSAERAKLNERWQTSEYMTSYRYGLEASEMSFQNGKTFRTKQEAEAYLQGA